MRILALSTGLTAVVLILFAVPLAIALRQSATDRAVQESEYVAQGVADYLSAGNYTQVQSEEFVKRVNERNGTQVAVLLPGGIAIGASLPTDTPAPPAVGSQKPDGDSDHDDLGTVTQPRTTKLSDGWLIDVQATSKTGRSVVRGFVGEDVIRHEVRGGWAWVGGGAAALLILSAAGAELVSRRLTRPLVATASTASALSAGNLDARAPLGGAREISQVSNALNQLADRIEDLLTSERETIADLSHRLRTPMTAIRLDVEALPDSDKSRELARHVAQLERTLTTVISNARLPQKGAGLRRCDATDVVRGRVAFWTPLAEDQGRAVSAVLPGHPVEVGCSPDDLLAAVDALLENVIAHTPEGTSLRVEMIDESGQAVLDIIDHGDGIPLGASHRGRSDRGSTGLGMDIARNCAESTGGSLEIRRGPDGSNVVRMNLQHPHSRI